MEAALDPDRYEIMTYIAGRMEEFRLAELYDLLKKQDPQKWLFYQPCFDHVFLHSRIKPEGSGNRAENRVYICRGIIEKLRYKYACIMERYNRFFWEPS